MNGVQGPKELLAGGSEEELSLPLVRPQPLQKVETPPWEEV